MHVFADAACNVGAAQGCVFTQDINKAIYISDAMETGTVQVNAAPARGPDHFPFQVQFSFPHWLEAGCASVLCLTTCMMHLVQFYLSHWQCWPIMQQRFPLCYTLPVDMPPIGRPCTHSLHLSALQGFRDSGIGSQGIKNSLALMVKHKSTVVNLTHASYTLG